MRLLWGLCTYFRHKLSHLEPHPLLWNHRGAASWNRISQWEIDFSFHYVVSYASINIYKHADMIYLWSISSICPSDKLDPPTERSTKTENSFSLSFMKIPRLIWNKNPELDKSWIFTEDDARGHPTTILEKIELFLPPLRGKLDLYILVRNRT